MSVSKLAALALAGVLTLSAVCAVQAAPRDAVTTVDKTGTRTPLAAREIKRCEMIKVGIIGAMQSEVADLQAAMKITRRVEKAGMEFVEGTLGGREVVVVQSGMGKVNAGICAQLLIEKFSVTHIINTGAAGSLNANLNIGDIVVSVDAVQHDFDVAAIGFRKGEIPYTGKVAFEADAELRQRAMQAIHEAVPGVSAVEGRICTGDQFIHSREEKGRIVSEFAADCAEMEGGSVAQTCYLNGIPFVVLRAISDKADGSGYMDFMEFEKKAARNSSRLVRFMLEHWQDFQAPAA